jgi:hypothetical protein
MRKELCACLVCLYGSAFAAQLQPQPAGSFSVTAKELAGKVSNKQQA